MESSLTGNTSFSPGPRLPSVFRKASLKRLERASGVRRRALYWLQARRSVLQERRSRQTEQPFPEAISRGSPAGLVLSQCLALPRRTVISWLLLTRVPHQVKRTRLVNTAYRSPTRRTSFALS